MRRVPKDGLVLRDFSSVKKTVPSGSRVFHVWWHVSEA
jgi:hypothetical protein